MKKQVLIVDEHEGFRNLLSLILAEHQVVLARSAREALNWLSSGNVPDVIVTNTPDSDDASTTHFLADLKCTGLFANIPVVVLGSQQRTAASELFLSLGVNEVVAKPFNPFQLQEKIRRIVKPQPASALRPEPVPVWPLGRVAFG